MLVHTYDGVDLEEAVTLREERNYSARAEIGEVETIGVVVDDVAGTRDFVGYKPWAMRETACAAGSQVAWHGFVGDQEISRGDEGSAVFPYASGRSWDLDLTEDNGYLSRIHLHGADCKRPAETVSARLSWLLGKPGITGVVSDYGLVASSSLTCDANDYTGREAADVARDLALVTGFNFHTRYREATDDLELIFLHFRTSPLDVADFQVSNDPADLTYDGDGRVTGNTWPVGMRAKLLRGTKRIASGVDVAYTGGTVFVDRPTTEAAFGIVHQTAPTASVKTRAAAVALGEHLLDEADEQDERITGLRIQLPATELNRVRQGQLMKARLVHLPGWEALRDCRVVFKAFSRPDNDDQESYDVDLELTPAEPLVPVTTHARAMRPSDRDPRGGGTYRLLWDFDGDNPKGGDPGDPKSGLVDYYPVGAKPSDGWRGLVVLGAGSVTVEFKADGITVVEGDFTVTWSIRRNGTIVGSQDHTTTGGLRFVLASCDFSATFDVEVGDVIEGWCTNNLAAGLTIPSGTGSSDHRLMLDGTLYA